MRIRNLWLWLIAVIAVSAFVGFLYAPFAGDDLSFLYQKTDSLLDYPRWAARHYLGTNGRMGDKLLMLFFYVPRWLMAAACAAIVGLMYWLAVKCSRASSPLAAIVLVAAMAFGLPWWDSMVLFCCQFNYIWSSAIVLLAVYLIYKCESFGRLSMSVSAVVCLVAGMMHEAAALPLCIGWVIMFVAGRFRPSRHQWVLLVAFGLGSILTLLSPALWSRAASLSAPDDTPLLLLLKSCPVAVLLWIVIAVCLTFRKGREALLRLFDSHMGVFAIAAAASTAISVASGIVGRSGLYAELYSMIAFIGWLSMYRSPSCTPLALLLGALVAAQAVGVAVWQVRLGREYREFEDAYMSAPSGVVYMDCTRDTDIPWWTLGRLRGVPDPDDLYLLYCLSQYRHPAGAWPVIVPSEVRTATAGRLQNGDILCDTLPPSVRYISFSPGQPQVGLVEIDGREWTAQRVGHLYHLSPRIIDPGDRF